MDLGKSRSVKGGRFSYGWVYDLKGGRMKGRMFWALLKARHVVTSFVNGVGRALLRRPYWLPLWIKKLLNKAGVELAYFRLPRLV